MAWQINQQCVLLRGFAGDPRLFIDTGLELFKIYWPRIAQKDLRKKVAVNCSVTAVYELCNGSYSQDMQSSELR